MEMSQAEQKEFDKQWEILSQGVFEITPENEFKKMLAHSIMSKKPLRVKCGIDPTLSDIHLGHIIPYKKMRQFQDLGHIGVVVIGDYTAQIGDPSGKNESRVALTKEVVKKNAAEYMEQLFTVLDKNKTEIRYQSEWFEKVSLAEIMSWAAETTMAKLLSHETFSNRIEQNLSLGLHEMFYPVLQGMDSVFIHADVELGGSDQKFNVLMGRDYQKHRGTRPQAAILLPLIMGLDGAQKMSKSLGNFIAIRDEAFDKFGKVMSIPDSLMENYAQYVAGFSISERQDFLNGLKNQTLHPNEAKKILATNIVAFFHGEEVANAMREQFERVFAQKKIPDEMEDFSFTSGMSLVEILVKSGLCESNADAKRMITQNAVSVVDGEKLQKIDQIIDASFENKILKVGKRRFVKLALA